MNPQSFELIQTKMTLPAARRDRIDRTHLIQRALDCPQAGIVLVCAPAGYGKSTLMVEFCQTIQRQGSAVAWYSIDPDDDRISIFWSYLIQAITGAVGSLQQLSRIGQMIRSASRMDFSDWMPVVINAVSECGQDLTLVLDDYHFIHNQAIHKAISNLCEHLPANMRLIIGTRTQPQIPLARLRARGKLIEYQLDDLRFDLDETGKFLNQVMKLELAPDDIRVLEERTEGWATGLQLAALALTRLKKTGDLITGFPGGHRYLVNYLIEEVFDGLTEEQRDFLLKTALLDRMCAPLCDAVLNDRKNSKEMINDFERLNLFIIPLDEDEKWYRYHHLFRDFLLQKKQEINDLNYLHIRASHWFSENGFLLEAANHAFAANDWEYAAGFVEAHGFSAIIRSEITALAGWCARFPEDVIDRHPLLAVNQCWGWVLSVKRDDREKINSRLTQARLSAEKMRDERILNEVHENEIVIRQMMALAPHPDADLVNALDEAEKFLRIYSKEDAGRFSFLLNIAYIYMALNKTEKAIEALKNAGQIARSENLYFGIIETTFQLAGVLQASGTPRDALTLINNSIADLRCKLGNREQELPGIGGLEIAAGSALFELNMIDEAEERIMRGLDLVGWGINPYYYFVGNFALFQLYFNTRRMGEARFCLKNLVTVWPDISFLTKGYEILCNLTDEKSSRLEKARARKWCDDFVGEIGDILRMPGMGPYAGSKIYYQSALAWIRIQSEINDPTQVMPVVTSYFLQAESAGLKSRMVELLLIKTALMADGQISEGDWEALERLLMEATDEGFFQKFISFQHTAVVLDRAARQGRKLFLPELFLAKIAHRWKVYFENKGLPTLYTKNDLNPKISGREREILRLLERGRTNLEIAETLVVTVGTVKSHVNHILRKMNASNRTQAVARARELGFLDEMATEPGN